MKKKNDNNITHSYSQGIELSAVADLHVILPRDGCCFIYSF